MQSIVAKAKEKTSKKNLSKSSARGLLLELTEAVRQSDMTLARLSPSVRRVAEYMRLLTESELPISEISSFVGYSDNNYFIKVFRRHYGMTPGDYRKLRK